MSDAGRTVTRQLAHSVCRVATVVALAFTAACASKRSTELAAQAGLPAPKSWTAAEDHRQMMAQLGITALRPGPSGNEQDPNHANYDEATANPFQNLPDVLTFENG